MKQHANFKNAVQKNQDHCYLLNKRPVSDNEGNLRVNYKRIDAKTKTPALNEFDKSHKNSRFFKVPACQLNNTGCSLSTRKAAK